MKKILSLVLVIAMVLAFTATAYAAGSARYSISNLAPNGVLWSYGTVSHAPYDSIGYNSPDNGAFTSGTKYTCRIYISTDLTDSGKTMNYLNIYPSTTYNDDWIYDNFYEWSWSGKMKFSNDENVKVVTAGEWGIN